MRQSPARVDASDSSWTMQDGHKPADGILYTRRMQDRPLCISDMLAMHLGSPDGLNLCTAGCFRFGGSVA